MEPPAKKYKLAAEQMRNLVPGMGPCIASDRITVDGERVGSMYRDPEENDGVSWVFLSGDETQEYMDDASNLAVYDVNTIANYDPDIIPYLFALPGQRFDRDGAKLVEGRALMLIKRHVERHDAGVRASH